MRKQSAKLLLKICCCYCCCAATFPIHATLAEVSQLGPVRTNDRVIRYDRRPLHVCDGRTKKFNFYSPSAGAKLQLFVRLSIRGRTWTRKETASREQPSNCISLLIFVYCLLPTVLATCCNTTTVESSTYFI